jgi:hypothetical protein
MVEYDVVLQKIELAIKINSGFLEEQLPTDRISFLYGRIEAYEHCRDMIKDLWNKLEESDL